MNKNVESMREEMRSSKPSGEYRPDVFRTVGYENSRAASASGKRADAIRALFLLPEPFIYKNDLIAGSIIPLFTEPTDEDRRRAEKYMATFPERTFFTNSDHYAPDYKTAVTVGIPGLTGLIEKSKTAHAKDADSADKTDFLDAMKTTLEALEDRLRAYAKKAEKLIGTDGYSDANLSFIRDNCLALCEGAPQTFAQGLQLVWMIHTCFLYEGRYAMALGRVDQYLYPLFERDVKNGTLTPEFAEELLANTFIKICESRYRGGDDVVNICVAGVTPDGEDAVNDLSYRVLWAVRDVNLPGPNLSARINEKTPDRFLDECLKVIGTGLGYPALMNDNVNIAALSRYGYEPEDVLDYCMVGCIENFIAGKQPPWSDGRFDPINSLLAVLKDCGENGPLEGRIGTMDAFMEEYRLRLARQVKDYVAAVNKAAFLPDPENHTSPFLSCFCQCCIERALDVNMGGAKYKSAHGAALMGIGTVSDSLSAIEKAVFTDRKTTLRELDKALAANFDGYGELREELLAAPKYGNNDDFVDKYAVFYTDYLGSLFDLEHSHDGGALYIAMASNTSNIPAGKELGATPDGRLAGKPLSDAASPSYGRDTKGVTSTLLSVSKPDYSRCACGTVVNQKFSPSVFKDGKREKLAALIRVYFRRGGQEVQINSTSRKILKDAMVHPENYQSLVVRVSGFSALYITLDRDVQEDILARTQHEEV